MCVNVCDCERVCCVFDLDMDENGIAYAAQRRHLCARSRSGPHTDTKISLISMRSELRTADKKQQQTNRTNERGRNKRNKKKKSERGGIVFCFSLLYRTMYLYDAGSHRNRVETVIWLVPSADQLQHTQRAHAVNIPFFWGGLFRSHSSHICGIIDRLSVPFLFS